MSAIEKLAQRPTSNRPVNRQILTHHFAGIPYTQYFDDLSGRYSIDNVRIKFVYDTKFYDYDTHETKSTLEYLSFFLDQYRENIDVSWKYHGFQMGYYSSVATMTFRNGGTATFLVGRYAFREKKGIAAEIVADFNPNKVLFDDIRSILYELSLNAISVPELVRFDLAIDVPVSRSNVSLQYKGRAGYQLIYNSDDNKTEYLGKRGNHNRLKIYNKSLELGLDTNITRCEITLERFSSVADHLPDIYYTRDLQVDMDFRCLDFAVRACILHPDLISELKSSVSRNTWKKYKAILDEYQDIKLVPVDVAGIDAFVREQLDNLSLPSRWCALGLLKSPSATRNNNSMGEDWTV